MASSYATDVPTIAEADVVVAGGGPAGIGTALTAARNGASVVLAETYVFLGGTFTAGLVNEFHSRRNRPPLMDEIAERLLQVGGAISRDDGSIKYAPEAMKYVLDQLAVESGVRLLLHAPVCDAVVESGQVRGVAVAAKSGRSVVRAAVTVDATGDGDVAVLAGAAFEKGRPADGLMSAPTLVFRMGNVDVDAALASFRQEKEVDGENLDHVRSCHRRGEPIRVYELSENMLRIARERGVVLTTEQEAAFYSPRHPDLFHTTPLPGVVVVNMAQVPNVDMVDPLQLSAAEVFARRHIQELVGFLTRYTPGFENAYLLDSGPAIGVRETRRIVGDYMLTEEDRFGGREFDDGVLRLGAFMDMHHPDGRGTVKRALPGVTCTLPYRCLLPRGLEGILVAGRCISATVEANIKGFVTCLASGQVAGIAAARAVQTGQLPRALDIAALKAAVQQAGLGL